MGETKLHRNIVHKKLKVNYVINFGSFRQRIKDIKIHLPNDFYLNYFFVNFNNSLVF